MIAMGSWDDVSRLFLKNLDAEGIPIGNSVADKENRVEPVRAPRGTKAAGPLVMGRGLGTFVWDRRVFCHALEENLLQFQILKKTISVSETHVGFEHPVVASSHND